VKKSADVASITGDQAISVVIIDDHEAIRLALATVCNENNFKIMASTDSVNEALETIADKTVDVAILDLSLADGSKAEENVQRLVSKGISVLVFSIADKAQLVRSALKAGAAALVPKSHSMAELVEAIRMVAAGMLVNNLQTTAAIDADQEFTSAKLSPREQEVLSLYASGLALKQVAYSLNITVSTAKEHIDRVRNKYATIGRPAVNKTELLLRAIEDGLIEEGNL
jgi:two-component system uhpT operon response regulator UhpA